MLWRERVVEGTCCGGNVLWRERVVEGTCCGGNVLWRQRVVASILSKDDGCQTGDVFKIKTQSKAILPLHSSGYKNMQKWKTITRVVLTPDQ